MIRSLRVVFAFVFLFASPAGASVGAASIFDRLYRGAFQGESLAPEEVRLQQAPVVEVKTISEAPGLSAQDLKKLEEIAALIKKEYVDGDKISSKALYYAAIRGLTEELDPYSIFFTPEEYKEFKATISGSREGVGIGLGARKDGEPLPVLYVVPRGPADSAGIKSGDLIMAVDGEPTAAMPLEDAIAKITGAKGTQVTLTIGRMNPVTQKLDVIQATLTRDVVQTANVYATMLSGGAGYVYFNEFRENTAKDVLAEARKLKAAGMTSLILDVRDNPGGRLDVVHRLAAAFLAKGQVVVKMKDRTGAERPLVAPIDGEFMAVPVKILVNGGSASASEILAGALQDHKRAAVYGATTFGKGTAQMLYEFADGCALKLTVNRWYTPKGNSIQKDEKTGMGGVAPDVPVAVSPADEARIIDRIVRRLNGAPVDPAPLPDPVLERALRP